MDCTSLSIPYQQIGYFTKIITDYLDSVPQLQSFFEHPVSLEGIRQSIEARKKFQTNRPVLVEALQSQYASLPVSEKVQANIRQLLEVNTFTVVTAHQPNIFSGYLYFVYKILHIIRLADTLNSQMPDYRFVPVYYMGSEDADLDELGKIFLNGEEIRWQTDQTGAVGRMKNKGLNKIIDRLEGELGVLPFGKELIEMLREAYTETGDVQTATFRLVNRLFAEYGLVVLIPDQAALKAEMSAVFEDDLLRQTPSAIMEQTIRRLAEHYKVQANPREINLFYLRDNIRERIVRNGEEWKVVGHDIRFTEAGLLAELKEHPECFSPNVILRGLFQETILPNIAFIGGGGETAYWLELKELFGHYQVPFPVLMLRNSFLFIDRRSKEHMQKLGIGTKQLFLEERLILNDIVKRNSEKQLALEREIGELTALYERIEDVAGNIDSTLGRHVVTLKVRAQERLFRLENKMLWAEKRRYSDQQNQVRSLKKHLFPRNGLQERVDNFMPYYAKWGPAFLNMIYDHSPALEPVFVVLEEV